VDKLPFVDGALKYTDEGLFPGGTCNNQRAYEHAVHFAPGIPEEIQQLLFTPETSGGLLIAVAAEKVGALTERFAAEGQPFWVVGEVVTGEGIEVI
jgi:selenide,water dikinase